MRYLRRALILPFAVVTIFFVVAIFAQDRSPNFQNNFKLTEQDKLWLDAHPVVRVRISPEYPPFEFYHEGKYKGLAVDYLDLVSKRLGIRFEPVDSDLSWSEALEHLKIKDGVDLILMLTQTAERERDIKFTKNYISFPLVIFSRKDAPFISGVCDLRRGKTAVEKGFIYSEWLKRDVPGIELVEIETPAQALKAVSVGSADTYIANLAMGSYLINSLGLVNLKIAAPTMYDQDKLAMGVRQDWPELASLIDRALDSITDDEALVIRNHWLSIRYEHGIQVRDVVFWILLVTIIAFLFIIQLRRLVKLRTDHLAVEIVQRKRTEENLAERNQFIESIVNLSPDLLYIYDLVDCKNLYVNKGIQTMLNYSTEEVEQMGNQLLGLLMHPDDFGKYLKETCPKYAMVKDNEFIHHKYRMKQKNGQWCWLDCSELIYKRNAENSPLQILGVAHDITERESSEEQIRHSLKQKEVMLKEIHHRVKNNMQVMYSLLDLQSKQISDRKICTMFEEGRNRILSMALIHETLYNSEDLVSIDFNEYLRGLMVGIAETYNRSNVTLIVNQEQCSININTGIPCGLIVNELVSNSLKYAFPDGMAGEVRLGIKKDNKGFNVITVEDNGIGFPLDIDFKKTSSLGLQIVNVLIGQINGTIELERVVGGGTKFCIIFPGSSATNNDL